MLGLLLAALFGLLLFTKDIRWPWIFKRSTRFLFRWYLCVAILAVLVFGIAAVVASVSVSTFFLGQMGWLVGLLGGGMVAGILFLYVLVGYALEILGSMLLYKSVKIESAGGEVTMNFVKMTTGVVALVVGIFFLPVFS